MNAKAIYYIKVRLEETSAKLKEWLFTHPDFTEKEDIKKHQRFVLRMQHYLEKGTELDYYFLDEDDEIKYSRLLKMVVTLLSPGKIDEKIETYVTASGKQIHYYYKQ